MKHLAIAAFAAMSVLFACTKDSVQTEQADPTQQNLPVDDRGNKVTICHRTGNGSYHAITVSINALPAHLAHGDYLPDADGDGYSAVGACIGSMDDCDDNNADVHPGAAEICDNDIDDNCDGEINEGCCESCCFPFFTEESLNSGAPFEFYYDSDVNDCLGYGETVYIISGQFAAYATTFFETPAVFFASEAGECIAVVGVDITQAEYDAALATIRAVIAANPDTPNFCGPGCKCPSGQARMESLQHKAKEMMREKLEHK